MAIMITSWKSFFFLLWVACILKFSGEEENVQREDHIEHEENETKKEKLVSVLRKGEMENVRQLIKDGALEEYYLGIYESKESETLRKINDKVLVVGTILDFGLAVIPTDDYLRRHPSDEKLFNVTLIPGTDLTMTLLVNMDSMKNETLVMEGNIPLHIISGLPDVPLEIFKLFVQFGTVDIDYLDPSIQLTSLMIASARGNLDIVKFLVENGANVNHVALIPLDPFGRLGPLYDYIKIFTRKELVVPKITAHFSALVVAVYEQRPDILRYLLKSGADVNVNGQNWVPLLKTAYSGNLEIMEILLKNGIDVNSKGPLGATALHKVAETGDVEMAKLLLLYGADPNATDDFGWTPLHVAALFAANSPDSLIELLLDSGCGINSLTDGGFSPLNLVEAGNNPNFLTYLVKNLETLKFKKHKGLEEVDSDEGHSETIELLLERGADLEHKDDILGWSTLHWAAASGDLRVVRMLAEKYGAMISSRSKMGLNPFRTAKHFGRKTVSHYLNTDRNLVV